MRIVTDKSNFRPASQRAVTMIELMVTVTVAAIIASFLLVTLGKQSGTANDKVTYLQNRDALMAEAQDVIWNYQNPGEPNEGRLLTELHFDGSVQSVDLFYLWEIIQPHFQHRDKLRMLAVMNFNSSEFEDFWMTNLIGIDRTGYPYRTDGLEILELEYTKISDTGLKILYQHNRQMQPTSGQLQQGMGPYYPMASLKRINLYGCPNVTHQGIADLKKAIPGLIVISNWDPTPNGP